MCLYTLLETCILCEQLRFQGAFNRVRESLRRRLQLCLQEQGQQFEHLR